MTKNGYRRCVIEELNLLGNELTTYLELTRSYYTKTWSLKIPSKVRLNLWRIITSNFLPTLSNLKARRLRYVALCPLCGEQDESVSHIFRYCNITFDQQRLRSDNLRSVCMPLRSYLCRRNGVWQCNHRRGLKNRHKKAREANGAAHAMAAWGRRSDSSTFWVEEAPLEVEPIVLRDQGRTA